MSIFDISLKEAFQRLAFVTTFYTGTFLPEVLLRQKHWHHIQERLMLGGIPIESSFMGYGKHHHDIMKEAQEKGAKLGAVFSIVNEFEIEGKGLGLRPVSPKTWEALGVKHFLVPMDDFGGNIDIHKVKEIVDEMKKVIDRGESVYVHCKAGKGRSFSFVVAYLLLNTDWDVTQIFAILRKARPQVSPSNAQFELIEAFRKEFCPEKAPLNKESKIFASYRKGWLKYAQNPLVQAMAVGALACFAGASLTIAGLVALAAGIISTEFNHFNESAYLEVKGQIGFTDLSVDQLNAVQSGLESAKSWQHWRNHLLDVNAGIHYKFYRAGIRLQQEKAPICNELPEVIAKAKLR